MLKKFGWIVKAMSQNDTLIRFHRDDLWALGHGMRRASNGSDIGPEARAAIYQLRVEAPEEVVALTLAVERVWFMNTDDNDPARYLPDGRRNWDAFPLPSPSHHPDSWLRVNTDPEAGTQAEKVGVAW